MRPYKILPGAVDRILSTVTWRDRHIVVYVSDANDIIIMEDTTLLQIIEVFGLSTSFPIVASMESHNGSLAICSSNHLVVYEPLQVFGKPPVWREVIRDTVLTQKYTSLSWVNENHLCLSGILGELLIYNKVEQRAIWQQKLGYRFVTSDPLTQTFIAYGYGNKSTMAVFSINEFSPSANFSQIKVIDTGRAPILKAWFINSKVIATQTSAATFIWNLESISLLSTISTGTTLTILLPINDESILLVSHEGALRLEMSDNECTLCTLENYSIGFDSIDQEAASTPERLYIWTPQQNIDIFTPTPNGLSFIGKIGGVTFNRGNNLCCNPHVILAGSTLLSSECTYLGHLNGIDKNELITHSRFLDPSSLVTLVRDEESKAKIQLYRNTNVVWSSSLQFRPLCLDVSTASLSEITVLLSNGIVETYNLADGSTTQSIHLQLNRITSGSLVAAANVALVSSSNQAHIIHLSEPASAVKVFQKEDNSKRLDSISISNASICAIAYSQNDESILEWWEASSTPELLKSISIGDTPVISMAWSNDSTLLSVMTADSLQVFASVNSSRGFFIKISEVNRDSPALFCSITRSTMCWSSDNQQLFLYNGKQFVAFKADIDDSTQQLVRSYGFDSSIFSDLRSFRAQLDSPLPIYHPDTILLILEAFEPSLASSILAKLMKEVKFSETTDDNMVVLLDPYLNLESLDDLPDEVNLSDMAINYQKILQERRLRGLTQNDQSRLQKLLQVLSDPRDLDAYSLCALAHAYVNNASTPEYKWWVYAWFSESQLQLSSTIRELNLKEKSLPVWLHRDLLAAEMEQQAKAEFASKREPTSVSLYYIALRKLDVLRTLWRISSGHPEYSKTVKLLGQDFTTDRWRTAAQKNAYALLSKHRPEYAAAFFLLGDSIVDCCKVLIDKLENMSLAICVARVYDGDGGEGMKFLRSRYFDSNDSHGNQSSFYWLQFWATWMNNDFQLALDKLIHYQKQDLGTIFMYSNKGGIFTDAQKELWKEACQKVGILPLVVSKLISSLKLTELPHADRSQDDNAQHYMEYNKIDNSKLEDRKPPTNLKPPPSEIQLEPDMSAFGF